jgi:hypothetical protein
MQVMINWSPYLQRCGAVTRMKQRVDLYWRLRQLMHTLHSHLFDRCLHSCLHSQYTCSLVRKDPNSMPRIYKADCYCAARSCTSPSTCLNLPLPSRLLFSPRSVHKRKSSDAHLHQTDSIMIAMFNLPEVPEKPWPRDSIAELLARLDIIICSRGQIPGLGDTAKAQSHKQHTLKLLRESLSNDYSEEEIERKLYGLYKEGDRWPEYNFGRVFKFGSCEMRTIDEDMERNVSERFKNLQLITPRQSRSACRKSKLRASAETGNTSSIRKPTRTKLRHRESTTAQQVRHMTLKVLIFIEHIDLYGLILRTEPAEQETRLLANSWDRFHRAHITTRDMYEHLRQRMQRFGPASVA